MWVTVVVLFLRHIICLLRRVVLYVNHRGLQADLKGGSGWWRRPPQEKQLKLLVGVPSRTEVLGQRISQHQEAEEDNVHTILFLVWGDRHLVE